MSTTGSFSKGVVRLGRGPAILAMLMTPIALYFIGRTAAAGSGSPAAYGVLATIPPADYRGLMQGLARASQSPLYKPGPDALALSRKAAVAAPTSFEPFFVAAQVEYRAGNVEQAIRLMEESRRRRPSHAATRLALIIYYGQERRFQPLLEELSMALALNQDARRLILPELSTLVADPSGRPALARMLARNPLWRAEFVDASRGKKIKPEDARLLLDEVLALTGGRAAPERQLYLQSLLEAGQFATARRVWASALPSAERAKDGLVFDGAFSGSPAAPPFNWQFTPGGAGRAEPSAKSGRPYLDIVYYGGQEVALAEQAINLRPGTYQLSFIARSETGLKSAELAWRLFCDGQPMPLVDLGWNDAGAKPTPRRARFSVPAACAGQRLLLVGSPGDVSAEVRAEASALEITRVS